jgi:hypothetical protein
VRQCFLRELKEAKIMVVTWIPGTENEADMFTNNLMVQLSSGMLNFF